MELSNIQVGNTYKNYKLLCETLGEPIKAGNMKIAQIKEWERFFKFTKQGHKFIIEEVYDKPLIKQDLRSLGNNAAFYIDEVEHLILDLLGQERNRGKLFLSRNRLLKELKMINENYSYYRNHKINLSKFMNIDIEEINDFYESSNSTFKSNLETALNRLKKQSLVHWGYALTVCYIDTKVELTTTGEIKAVKRHTTNSKGEKVVTYDTVKPVQQLAYRKATEEEIRIILEIEREALKDFGCNEISDIFRQGKIEDFYNVVKEKVFEQTNIIFYYNSYEIIFNDKHIQERLEEIQLLDHERHFKQEMLNASVMDKLIDNAKLRHEKAMDKYLLNGFDDEENLHKKVLARSNKNYIGNTDILTEKLINKDTIDDNEIDDIIN